MTPSSDSVCKRCGQPIRWVSNDGHRVPLNYAPVTSGGSFLVVGANTAMRIPVALRHNYVKLYEPHNTKKSCKGWENAQAMKKRQAAYFRYARRQKAERDALPENVALFRDHTGKR